MELAGKHVVVTGAASGIGRALVERFVAEGARAVVAADIDEAGAKAVAAQVGERVDSARVDVRRSNEIEALVASTESRHGPIDLFCSNAGIAVVGTSEVDDESWRRIIDINLMAHVFAARAVLPGMRARGEGYLLNTASAAGLLAQIGSTPYSVTKHAAIAFAESIAIEHGQEGIKVSVLCPQAVRTAMTAGTEEGGVAGVDGMIEPEEVAEAVVAGLAEERFLILPHPEVHDYMIRKANDVDRWLTGMQRLRERYVGRAI